MKLTFARIHEFSSCKMNNLNTIKELEEDLTFLFSEVNWIGGVLFPSPILLYLLAAGVVDFGGLNV